jgi:hypothetical protein
VSAGAAWERIVRAALLGTERQAAPADTSTGDDALDGAVAALADRSAEARLLGTAVLLDAWRRAGQRPSHAAAEPPEPAPGEAERFCSPLAARVLRQVLASGPPLILAEWMTLTRTAGAAIPYELLPAVLDAAHRNPNVRDEVAGALGPRGRWLAAQHPAWTYAGDLPADPAAGWQTGTAEERVRILYRVRASDPAAGRALLQTTWAADPSRDRAAFVAALSVGLGMDDEPFLESVLDDKRSKEVRAAAARLLAKLPRSRLVGRMVERLAPLLSLHVPEGLLARIRGGAAKIEVRLPAECDKAMQRDGIEPKPSHGVGERTWWLQQMLAVVPPSSWTALWEMDAAAVLGAAHAGEEGPVLVRGWTDATLRHRDAAWAEALIATQSLGVGYAVLKSLAAMAAPDRLEPLILDRVRKGGVRNNEPATLLLDAVRRPWSRALTHAVLTAVPTPLQPSDYALRERLNVYALHMHPSAAVATLREQGDPHEGVWVDRLHLRNTLYQAFA